MGHLPTEAGNVPRCGPWRVFVSGTADVGPVSVRALLPFQWTLKVSYEGWSAMS